MATPASIRGALRAIMQRGAEVPLPEDEFNSLALQIFAHQFAHNTPYRRYCERRRCTPGNIASWSDVPAVPTAAFKEVSFVAGEQHGSALTFRTSGTTRGQERRGVHIITDPSLYQDSLLATFKAFVMPDGDRMDMISIAPPSSELPDSSLNYMISTVMQEFGAKTVSVTTVTHGIDIALLKDALEQSREPVCILGTSLAYVHALDSLDRSFVLPEGSRLMDTGGFKGETRVVTAEEMRSRYQAQLGIPAMSCINEYGMTELCSQYYDASFRDRTSADVRIKKGAPWLRARVVDPETLAPVSAGETGILQHFDMANLNSVSAVLTEDLAYERDDGFVLIGRAPGAQPRGCSIAMDMILQDSTAR
jgi:hypothetical protein